MIYTDSGFPLITDGNASEVVDEARSIDGGMGYDGALAGPFGSAAPPKAIRRIPASERMDHYRRQQAEQSSPYHWWQAGGCKILSQGSWGYCTDDQTEIFTDRGWVKWTDWDSKGPIGTVNPLTHAMEMQMPLARQVFDYDGEMIYSTNRRCHFAVTPNHRMLVRKFDERTRSLSESYSFTTADKLGWYAGLLPSPTRHIGTEFVEVEVPGDRLYDGDDFLALLSMITADGYAGGSEKTKNLVSFCCFDERNIERVRGLAARTGFKEKVSRPGVFERWSAGPLARWLRENLYTGPPSATTKRVPMLVKSASSRQIAHFLAWYGDQYRDKPLFQFFTSSEQLADDLQELLMKIGRRSTIGWMKARTGQLKNGQVIKSKKRANVTVSQSGRLSIESKSHIERERYRGQVFCATVPNGTLLTRRNGSVLISGNCWMFGTVGGMQCAYAQTGITAPHLNAHYPAWLGKNGRNQGGWAGEALGYIERFGVPEYGAFPGKPTNRAAYDRREARDNAALHKAVEFAELPRNDYDALCSVLLDPVDPRPVTLGLQFWGHLVAGLQWTPDGVLFVNSWGESWGKSGFGVLSPSRSVAFEQIAIERVTLRAA